MTSRADYGIDAPGVLAAAGATGLVLTTLGAFCRIADFQGSTVLRHTIWVGSACLAYAAIQLWVSKVGKIRRAARLLGTIEWRGDERVLDVGCGHGLLLIGAARRLTTGHAVGVDIWQQKDQWRNSPAATLANADCEGVRARVRIGDANACALPFLTSSFDVVLSSLVLHNIDDPADRRLAVREIARVLRPGGVALVVDLAGTRTYAEEFRVAGLEASISVGRVPFMPRNVAATKPNR